MSRDYTNNVSEIALVDQDSGALYWTESYDNYAVRMNKVDGKLYLYVGGEISLLDAAGQKVWSVVLENTLADYFPGSIRNIADSSEGVIYVAYSGPGYRYVYGGLAAIDKASGEILWDYYPENLSSFVGSNENLLFFVQGFGSLTVAVAK